MNEERESFLNADDDIPLRERVGQMIHRNLVETLNGPGTHMAWDGELEFGFKWNDGETTVFLEQDGEEVEFKYKIQVVKA